MDDSNKTLDNELIDTSEIADVVEDTSINDAIQNTMNGLDSLNELLNNSTVNNSVKPDVVENKEQGYLSNSNDVINPDVIIDSSNLNKNEINGTSENISAFQNNNNTSENIDVFQNNNNTSENIDVFQNNNTNNEIKDNLNNININNNSVNSTIENNVDSKNNITQATVEQKNNDTVAPVTPEIKENIVNNSVNNTDAMDESKLLEAFIGKNSEKILTQKFSLPAFFLNSFYMLYRKMFLSSIGVFLIYMIIPTGLVYLLYPSVLSGINTASYGAYGTGVSGVSAVASKGIYVLLIYILSYIILGVIFGVFFNKMYIKFASKKVAKISVEESERNQKELEIICSLKGGTSMEKVILGIYVQITIILAISLTVTIISIASKTISMYNGLKNADSTLKNSTQSSKFNGIISKNVSLNIKDEYNIDVPSVFKSTSNEDYELEYEYLGDNYFGGCKFNFYSMLGYSKDDELIKQMIEYYEKYGSSIKESKINDKIGKTNWSWFSSEVVSEMGYYATTKGKNVYVFEYRIYNDAPSDCRSYINKTLSSIESK